MARYPITNDYSNRQIDIELLQSIVEPYAQAVTVSSVTKPPKIVTGIEKLVQRYALLFLSSTDTVKFADNQGTNFMASIAGGTVQDNNGLLYVFAEANSMTLNQMRADDNAAQVYGAIPADEQIADATLLDYEIDTATSTVLLRILLTSAAGNDITFVIPTSTPR